MMNEMELLSRQAKRIKETYPPGTRLYLNNMEDPFSPVPSGTKGTVDMVDAIGQIHMSWDNGRTLALVPGVDSFRKLTAKELLEEHILKDESSLKGEFVAKEQPSDIRFSLLIRRNDSYQLFGSLDELREEVGRYFTEKEKASGIVDRLTSFMMKNEIPGYWTGEQKYQDMTVTCDVFFPAFDNPSIQAEVSKKRKTLTELIGDPKPALDYMLARASARIKQQAKQGMEELDKNISFGEPER